MVRTAAEQSAEAFEFVKGLAEELSAGDIDLPSFPDIAVRVRQALADDNCSAGKIARVVASEPALAAKLLRMANSALLHRGDQEVSELRTAINRLGHNMVRSAAITFAMAQMRRGHFIGELKPWLEALWGDSIHMGAVCQVLARHRTRVNADQAMLTGLLHGIGKLYILTRADRHPALFHEEAVMEHILADWHASIGKAIVEHWEFADDMAAAIADYQDYEREVEGPPDLTDILSVASLLVARDNPAPAALLPALDAVPACGRLELGEDSLEKLLEEAGEEIQAVKSALGS